MIMQRRKELAAWKERVAELWDSIVNTFLCEKTEELASGNIRKRKRIYHYLCHR